MDVIERFRARMARDGIVTNIHIIPDGKLHRFHVEGDKPGVKDGFYALHSVNDIYSGMFGWWRLNGGEHITWCSKRKEDMLPDECRIFSDHINKTKQLHEEEKKERQKKARETAKRIWSQSKPASDNHPYLIKKGIKAFGVRINSNDELIIPLFSTDKQLQTLQFISPEGEKRFLSGGMVSGNYFPIGTIKKSTDILFIGEGYATCMTIHQTIGYAVACAFNCGNLLPVARRLRKKFPKAEIIIAADNDTYTDNNSGMTKAEEAAISIGANFVYPDFTDLDTSSKPTDFNDLVRLGGIEQVKIQLLKTKQKKNELKNNHVIYRCFSKIESKPINWLWKPRIARGKITIFAGNPGKGKSQLTVSIAAIVTTGEKWPAEHAACEKGSVVFLSAEDDAADTIKPRLEAAGADLNRVFILDAISINTDEVPKQRQFNLKADLERLSDLLLTLKDVALVVIDPISAYLGNVDSHKNADVRALLSPLSDLASKHEVAIIGVSHLNKGSNNEALMRITGSLAFVAAARAAFLIVPDNEDEEKRLFLPIKNNIGSDKTGLAFTLQSHQLKNNIETSRVAWLDEIVLKSADEVISNQGDDEKSKVEEAEEFLFDVLSNGAMRATEIIILAENDNISEKTLRRAKKKIGVAAKREGFGKGSKQYWYIPIKTENTSIPGQSFHTFPTTSTGKYEDNSQLCDKNDNSVNSEVF